MAAEKAHEKQNKKLLRQANRSRRTSQAAVNRSLENASVKYHKLKEHDDNIKKLESDIRTTQLKIRTEERKTFGTENSAKIQSKVSSSKRNFGSVRSDQEAYRKASDSKEKQRLEKKLAELNEQLVKERAAQTETKNFYAGRRRR